MPNDEYIIFVTNEYLVLLVFGPGLDLDLSLDLFSVFVLQRSPRHGQNPIRSERWENSRRRQVSFRFLRSGPGWSHTIEHGWFFGRRLRCASYHTAATRPDFSIR